MRPGPKLIWPAPRTSVLWAAFKPVSPAPEKFQIASTVHVSRRSEPAAAGAATEDRPAMLFEPYQSCFARLQPNLVKLIKVFGRLGSQNFRTHDCT